MKLAAFFSGGKDSAYAIYDAKKSGHEIVVLFTIQPKSDESHLLHFPNISQTKLQSESMNITQIIISINDIMVSGKIPNFIFIKRVYKRISI